MNKKKHETITYEDLGFPILLIDVPLREILGEWILDINLNTLQVEVLRQLIHNPTSLQAGELRFIRKYFEMSTTAFGEVFGVTHAAVLKWEKGHLPSTALDIYIRMFVMDRLKANDAEFGQLYHQIPMADLARAKKRKTSPKPLTLRMKEHNLAHS